MAWKALVRWTVSAVGLREVRFAAARFLLPALEVVDFEVFDDPAVLRLEDFVVLAEDFADGFFVVELFEDFGVEGCEEEVWAWGAVSRTPAQEEPVSREPSSTAV